MKQAGKTLRGLKLVGGKVVSFVEKHAVKCAVVGACAVGAMASAHAGTDATEIATNAQSAFSTIAPISVTIAGFYVILRLAKRVVS